MKKTLKLSIQIFIIFFAFVGACYANTKSPVATSKNYRIKILNEDHAGLCAAFGKILNQPENENYILRQDEKKSLSISEVKKRVYEYTKPIFSKNSEFKYPKWQSVGADEIRRVMPEYLEPNKFRDGQYGVDFTFEKTEVDLDRDEANETLYQQSGYPHQTTMQNGSSPINRYFNNKLYLINPRSLAFYQGQPFFISPERGRIGYVLLSLPKTMPDRSFVLESVCEFSK